MADTSEITNLNAKLNTFALRSFRDEADHDYIAARMAYRAGLLSQFLWSSLHSIEKYCKCILVLNRASAKGLGHDIEKALDAVRQKTPCMVNFLDPRSDKFVQLLNAVGAKRYLEVSQYSITDHLEILDSTVWSIRRFCSVVSYPAPNGKDMLPFELERIKRAESEPHYKFKLIAGRLEAILSGGDLPEKEALLWQNAEFNENGAGPVRDVRSSFKNAPLWLYPEILDEVLKYVHLQDSVIKEYKAYAEQEAAKKKSQA